MNLLSVDKKIIMIIGCYARLSLQGDVKMCQCFKNIRLFLSRRGHYIGRKHHTFSPLVPSGTKCFLLHVTSLTGL